MTETMIMKMRNNALRMNQSKRSGDQKTWKQHHHYNVTLRNDTLSSNTLDSGGNNGDFGGDGV